MKTITINEKALERISNLIPELNQDYGTVNVLEKKGMRSAVIEAVTAAAKKNHQLGKKKEK